MSAKESDRKMESQDSHDKPPGVEELFAGAMEIVLHPWVICDDNIKVRSHIFLGMYISYF